MPFRKRPSARRRIYLNYISEVENALREAYLRYAAKTGETQSDVAAKLGVNKSVISKRLNGRSNLSAEAIADMAWGVGHRPRFSLEEVDVGARNIVVEKQQSQANSTADANPKSSKVFEFQLAND